MARYGFLGLGIMGKAMAVNLVQAGHSVTVWNRNREKCALLLELGAEAAATPADVATRSDITFAMVSDPAASEALCFASDGVLEGLAPGRGYVDMSTIDEDTSRNIATAVTDMGARYLEAPVSGTKKPAEDGTLIFLTAGDRTLYDDAAPALDIMGKKRLFLGEVGAGARIKLTVNMIMGGMMAVFAEGLGLARNARLDPTELLDVLAAGAVANPMFAGKGPLMLEGRFDPAFPLKHLQKDLRLAKDLAGDYEQSFNSGQAALDLYSEALEKGLGDLDMCALFKALTD